MIEVGDRIGFRRGSEMCEGYCTVVGVNYATKQVDLTKIPAGIEPGDEMVWFGKDLGGRVATEVIPYASR